MFLFNKFLLIGVGGVAVAGTVTGLGIYYGTQGSGQTKSPEETNTPSEPPPESENSVSIQEPLTDPEKPR